MAIKYGTGGADTIDGTSSADRIWGRAGNDILNGLGGNDRIYGELGVDFLTGGSGADRIYGGRSNDTLYGDDYAGLISGADQLYGGAGGDALYGGVGDDALRGDAGNDTLYGGLGDDVLDGGAGRDVFRFDHHAGGAQDAGGRDVVEGFAKGEDKLYLYVRPADGGTYLDGFSDLDTDGSGMLDDADQHVEIASVTHEGATRASTVIDLGGFHGQELSIVVHGATGIGAGDFW